MIDHLNDWSLWRKKQNKHLVLDDVHENKEVSKKYEEVWEGVKKEIETINDGKKIEYSKDLNKLGLRLMMICQWKNL